MSEKASIITAERFQKATGFPPSDDDLERCNCLLAGKTMHSDCGWCFARELPVFMISYNDRNKA